MKPESMSPLASESVNPGFLIFPKSRQRDNFNRKDIWSVIERPGSYVIKDTYFDLIISKFFRITKNIKSSPCFIICPVKC